MTDDHDCYLDEGPEPDGPLVRCQSPYCRETYTASTEDEWQGTPEMGATVSLLGEDADTCEYCGSEAKPVRGSEAGFLYGDDDYDESEIVYGLLDMLEDSEASLTRLVAYYGDRLPVGPANTRVWIENWVEEMREHRLSAIADLAKERGIEKPESFNE